MNIDQIAEKLKADGWVGCRNQFKPHSRCFYKRFPAKHLCQHNTDKPGMQVELSVSNGFKGIPSMELELCGGMKDGTALILHNYCLPSELSKVIALIPRLLKVWDYANEN